MRRRLLLLVVGCAVGLAGGGTYAAFSNQATNTSNTIASHPDFLAPPLTNHAVIKSTGGVANFVKPNGTFRVCANVGADPGNPATGLKEVLTDLAGLSTVALAPGNVAPCTAAHNYQSAQLTATISVPAGQTSTVTIATTARDNGLNANVASTSVVVDNDFPAATDVSAANATGIPNRPDAGDVITFTFDEPVDPDSIIDGWDGVQARPLTVTATASNDRLTFNVPIAGTNGLTIANDYITGSGSWTSSTIVAAGSPLGTQYRVTLGTASQSLVTQTRTSSTAMSWAPATTSSDRAGNAVPATAIPEAGNADTDF